MIMINPAARTRMAGWPAPTPRGPVFRLPSLRGVEAGRSPGLVVHQCPSRRAEASLKSSTATARGLCLDRKKDYQPCNRVQSWAFPNLGGNTTGGKRKRDISAESV